MTSDGSLDLPPFRSYKLNNLYMSIQKIIRLRTPSFFPAQLFIIFFQGCCWVIAHMNYEEIPVHSCVMKTGSSSLKNFHTVFPPGGTLDVTGLHLQSENISV